MVDISGIGHGLPFFPEDMEKERLKDIKARAGKIAFSAALGMKAKISSVSEGIARSQGALKWIEEVFGREKWKSS